MAEAEQSDRNASTSYRRPNYQNRPSSSYRGRGRANPSVSKALHLFGVRDLREILDRKHQEEEAKGGPPPDPSYNYLKDPSRENTNEHQTQRYRKEQHSERTSGDIQSRSHNFRGSRGRGRGGGTPRESRHYESEKTSFIQNPVNIKVELVASTGERNCKLDEETKIADIKHVPNYKLKDLRPSKNEGGTVRDTADRYRNEWSRGRGQRGRRGRGRGERGGRGRGERGRGQGRYLNRNNENNENNQTLQQTTSEVVSEENWDKECFDSLTQKTAENEEEKENKENHDDDYGEDHEHENYYQEGDEEEYLETNEDNYLLEEAEAPVEGNIELEENLVITSSEDEDKRKRMVTFKLDDNQTDEAANLDNEKKDVHIEPSQKLGDKKVASTKSVE